MKISPLMMGWSLLLCTTPTLFAQGNSDDAQATKAAIETPAMPENPPESWLTYHLAHPGPGNATPGDPNPAFFWKGRYHLHYIYKNRAARKKQKGRDLGPDWAHVSSEDMVHWTWHPTVLGPKTMGHGMFSGTGLSPSNQTTPHERIASGRIARKGFSG